MAVLQVSWLQLLDPTSPSAQPDGLLRDACYVESPPSFTAHHCSGSSLLSVLALGTLPSLNNNQSIGVLLTLPQS